MHRISRALSCAAALSIGPEGFDVVRKDRFIRKSGDHARGVTFARIVALVG